MIEVEYQQARLQLQPNESVLEALERGGHKIPNSCRKGLCHACLMQTEAPVPAAAQQGLNESQCQQGYFLACSCYPRESLSVSLPARDSLLQAVVQNKRMLNQTVLELTLQAAVRWQPGQNVLLWKNTLLGRPYSIASHPLRDGCLVLHILLHRHGQLSRWCHEQLQVGATVALSPPEGSCTYDIQDAQKPLLLVAASTGLAPVYGIVQEALARGHRAAIDLYAVAEQAEDLYLRAELAQLAQQYPQLNYYPVIQRGADATALVGDAADLIARRHPALRGSKVYLCGTPQVVEALHKRCFLAGANRADIVTDPFVTGHEP